MGRNIKPLQMFVDGLQGRCPGIGLFAHPGGSAARADAPVVQNPGDMNDLLGL